MATALVKENRADMRQAVLLPWWAVQLLAWALYCVVSFLSLTLWYGDPEWLHVMQILLEALSGALLVLPLGWSIKYTEQWHIVARFLSQILLVTGLALVWNVMRMGLFQTLFPEAEIWKEFGGWYFTSILIFALWTTLHYITGAYSAAAEEHSRAQEEHVLRLTAESLSREAQLQMLRYQINPHFIFNTMNSINALVATDRPKEARQMIDQFSDFLRITLVDENRLFTSLSDEIETIKRYLAVEKMRFTDRIDMHFDIDADSGSIKVPTLILQPIIENTIRHAVEGQPGKCVLNVKADVSENNLYITITDTGPGLKDNEDISAGHLGLGLQNIRARLNTAYAGDFDFSIANNKDGPGVKVLLRLLTQPVGGDT